jgi:hypothetical protein
MNIVFLSVAARVGRQRLINYVHAGNVASKLTRPPGSAFMALG